MRGSDKHAPRLDDQMKHDTASLVQGAGNVESRVEEFREQEGPGEGEPEAGDVARIDELAPHDHLDDETLRMRADVARHLGRNTFPGDREALVASAEQHFAPNWLIEALSRLPDGEEFPTVEAVWEALGGPPDPPRP